MIKMNELIESNISVVDPEVQNTFSNLSHYLLQDDHILGIKKKSRFANILFLFGQEYFSQLLKNKSLKVKFYEFFIFSQQLYDSEEISKIIENILQIVEQGEELENSNSLQNFIVFIKQIVEKKLNNCNSDMLITRGVINYSYEEKIAIFKFFLRWLFLIILNDVYNCEEQHYSKIIDQMINLNKDCKKIFYKEILYLISGRKIYKNHKSIQQNVPQFLINLLENNVVKFIENFEIPKYTNKFLLIESLSTILFRLSDKSNYLNFNVFSSIQSQFLNQQFNKEKIQNALNNIKPSKTNVFFSEKELNSFDKLIYLDYISDKNLFSFYQNNGLINFLIANRNEENLNRLAYLIIPLLNDVHYENGVLKCKKETNPQNKKFLVPILEVLQSEVTYPLLFKSVVSCLSEVNLDFEFLKSEKLDWHNRLPTLIHIIKLFPLLSRQNYKEEEFSMVFLKNFEYLEINQTKEDTKNIFPYLLNLILEYSNPIIIEEIYKYIKNSLEMAKEYLDLKINTNSSSIFSFITFYGEICYRKAKNDGNVSSIILFSEFVQYLKYSACSRLVQDKEIINEIYYTCTNAINYSLNYLSCLKPLNYGLHMPGDHCHNNLCNKKISQSNVLFYKNNLFKCKHCGYLHLCLNFNKADLPQEINWDNFNVDLKGFSQTFSYFFQGDFLWNDLTYAKVISKYLKLFFAFSEKTGILLGKYLSNFNLFMSEGATKLYKCLSTEGGKIDLLTSSPDQYLFSLSKFVNKFECLLNKEKIQLKLSDDMGLNMSMSLMTISNSKRSKSKTVCKEANVEEYSASFFK